MPSRVRGVMVTSLKALRKKAFKIVFFSALASRGGFGAVFLCAVVRLSIVICKAVSANRIVVAASKFLGATAACVILSCFAAEHRKLYWNGCVKVAMVICQ